jgi:hypothetical protein
MRNQTIALMLAGSLFGVAGCSHGRPTMVALYNPETKQSVECKPDPWATMDPWGEADDCAKGYEKYGFVRMNGK